jgi:hypothetical protein
MLLYWLKEREKIERMSLLSEARCAHLWGRDAKTFSSPMAHVAVKSDAGLSCAVRGAEVVQLAPLARGVAGTDFVVVCATWGHALRMEELELRVESELAEDVL